MGVSPSILPPARRREVGRMSRWPPMLQGAQLDRLQRWYTAFREMGTMFATLKSLQRTLGVSASHIHDVAQIWQVAIDDRVNIWEVLTVLTMTSFRISSRTKVAFLFRMWDMDKDNKLDVAEIAFLLRALLDGLGRYCSCERSMLPEKSAIRRYVDKTFKPMTPEDTFVAWSMRNRLFRSALETFAPTCNVPVDSVDFVLSGPRTLVQKKSLSRLRKVKLNARLSSTVEELGIPSRSPSFDDFGEESDTASNQPPEEAQKVPDVVIDSEEGKLTLIIPAKSALKESSLPRIKHSIKPPMNEPANVPVQVVALGRLKVLDADASWADCHHKCPLHVREGEQCLPLTKHEVLLANRLWIFLREGGHLDSTSVHSLLKLLQMEILKMDSVTALSEHRNIFSLTQTHGNRFFKNVVRRLRRGKDIPFHRFLQAVCPCASEARIRLFLHWHYHFHWVHEPVFIQRIRDWRRATGMTEDDEENSIGSPKGSDASPSPDSQKRRGTRAFLPKPMPSSNLNAGMEDSSEENDSGEEEGRHHVVSISELLAGAVVTKTVVEHVIWLNDLTEDQVLDEDEFIEYFCHEGLRGDQFEKLLRDKFKKLLAERAKNVSADATQDNASANSDEHSEDVHSGGVECGSFDERVSSLDVASAFNFMDAWDDEHE